MIQSQSNNQNKQKTSGLVHQPFPDHEINIFNPPKNNPNGYISKSNSAFERKKTSQLLFETETPQLSSPIPRNWLDRKLNAWVISSVLMLLLTNIVAGIVIYIYQINTKIKFDQSHNFQPLNSPNLAAEEFIDLETTSLSNIALPQDKKSNKAETNKSDVEPKIVPPLAIPPTSIPNYPMGMASSINPNYYYILTEYTGEESLTLVQQKVANVSLVNFPQGVFIYLGAFSEKSQAEKYVARMKKQGIYAYIYPFE
jgi:hypothetical protein